MRSTLDHRPPPNKHQGAFACVLRLQEYPFHGGDFGCGLIKVQIRDHLLWIIKRLITPDFWLVIRVNTVTAAATDANGPIFYTGRGLQARESASPSWKYIVGKDGRLSLHRRQDEDRLRAFVRRRGASGPIPWGWRQMAISINKHNLYWHGPGKQRYFIPASSSRITPYFW